MPFVPNRPTIEQLVRNLEERLRVLERAGALNGSVLNSGALVVKDSGAIAAHNNVGGTVVAIDHTGLSVSGTETVTGIVMLSNGGVAQSANYIAGTSGWRLSYDGSAEMHTPVFPQGVITNTMLAAPVVPYVTQTSATNFAVPVTTPAVVCTCTVPVPIGYTGAVVAADAVLTVHNNQTGPQLVTVRLAINGTQSLTGGSGHVVSTRTMQAVDTQGLTLTGLSTSFNVTLTGVTDANTITAQAANVVTIVVKCWFTR